MNNLYPIGTKTKFGKVSAIQFLEGERYYFLVDKSGSVSYIPQSAIKNLIV